MPLTVRIDQKTEQLIKRLVRQRGQSISEIIRDAIAILEKRPQDQEKTEPSFEAVRDLIGSVRGGPSDLSARTGDQFGRILQDRRHRG